MLRMHGGLPCPSDGSRVVKERIHIKYLLVALLNTIYGGIILGTITRQTPGFFLIVSIASILSILGLIGLVIYFISVFSTPQDSSKTQTAIKNWFSIAKNIDIVLIIGLLFRAFVLQPFIVDGNSMEPSYHDKEYILVDQLTYKFRTPRHGEVIIFRPPQSPNLDYIKRVIALPGETVVINNGQVSVNGHLLGEPYIQSNATTKTSEAIFRATVGPDEYFVMGDNREHSYDSREIGLIPQKNIVGKAWFRVYPLQFFGLINNPSFDIYSSPAPQTSETSI